MYTLYVAWRTKMNFLTTTEVSEKWGVSRRRITKLCEDGRIDGAILRGNTWLIPDNAAKPEDPRKAYRSQKTFKGNGEN